MSGRHRLDSTFLALLRCPLTHAPLRQDGDELVAQGVDPAPRYPIVQGRPILVEDAARLPEGVTPQDVRRQARTADAG